jgi:uncharacterized membrane protein
MDTKKYDAEKYEFYIKNAKKNRRQKIYAVLTLIIGVLFELLVYYMHVSFPNSLIGGIPVFAVIVWSLVVIHYGVFLGIGGSGALDLKNDELQEWNRNAG